MGCLYVDEPNLMVSAIFFPNDDKQNSQLYNFSLHALKTTAKHTDTYMWELGFLPAIATIFQDMGLDFTGAFWNQENSALFGSSLYPEMYNPICNNLNCSMLTIAKIGREYVYMVCIWCVYGVYMVCVWCVYGVHVAGYTLLIR